MSNVHIFNSEPSIDDHAITRDVTVTANFMSSVTHLPDSDILLAFDLEESLLSARVGGDVVEPGLVAAVKVSHSWKTNTTISNDKKPAAVATYVTHS